MLRAAVQQHKASHGEEWAGCFELSVGNADKGWLPAEEVRGRGWACAAMGEGKVGCSGGGRSRTAGGEAVIIMI